MLMSPKSSIGTINCVDSTYSAFIAFISTNVSANMSVSFKGGGTTLDAANSSIANLDQNSLSHQFRQPVNMNGRGPDLGNIIEPLIVNPIHN